ncbi:MAG TPA: hypothetical protein GX693_00850 [Firmicutes bacterium]|nr:hypothetical protein [Bacillota bacterium]
MWSNKAVGEMSRAVGETAVLSARIAGEMQPGDIPLNPGMDIAALKAGDAEPMEIVVEVPAGKSKRGWNYKPEALQAIVGEVMSQGLPGFLGHQKPEDVDTEFPVPVTHWVGAKWDQQTNKAYFRGVVDKAAADLKRWIKGKTIKTVSIFGIPKLQKAAGETNVVDYKPLSIDWTPLGRAGMSTAIVATGEMDDEITGELDGSHEELKEALRAAAKVLFGEGQDNYVWVRKVFDTYVIVEHENKKGTKLYNIPYGIVDGEVKFGEKTEVVKKEVYEPVGEIYGGERSVSWKELVAKLKEMLASKEVTVGQVVGEMGLTAETLAGEMAELKLAADAAETLDKVKEALGVTGEMDVLKVAEDAKKVLDESAKAGHESLINEVLKEKVAGEMAQGLVKKMLQVPETATKEQIAGEIDKLLADETVKAAIGKFHVDKPPVIGDSNKDGSNLRIKRQAI